MKRLALVLFGLCCSARLLHADCTLTNLGLTPLPDMGLNFYKGFSGGLYPNGANNRPPAHLASGMEIATNQISPLDASGNVDTNNGKIVMISVGMSNTSHEFASGSNDNLDRTAPFKYRADNDPAKNPQLTIVNGAQSGQDITRWLEVTNQTWATVNNRLGQAGVTSNQVQVTWVKHSLQNILQYGSFPGNMQLLQSHLETVARNLKTLYPNTELVYFSCRTRCYSTNATSTNPEPTSFENGFAVKWMIEKQINGDMALNFDSAKGSVVAPWLAWGPYFWADGETPRSDGLTWRCSDVMQNDFTHPSSTGVRKASDQLLAFFKTDPTATPWFLKKTVTGQPPSCAPAADVTSGPAPLSIRFTANASDAEGPIRDYQWTFDDGTFSTNANPVKTFFTPGTYQARLTVTDTNGNTTLGSVQINVSATAKLHAKFIDAQVAGDGSFRATVEGAANRTYIVEISSDLTNWTELGSLVMTNATVPFSDRTATNAPQRFYRARASLFKSGEEWAEATRAYIPAGDSRVTLQGNAKAKAGKRFRIHANFKHRADQAAPGQKCAALCTSAVYTATGAPQPFSVRLAQDAGRGYTFVAGDLGWWWVGVEEEPFNEGPVVSFPASQEPGGGPLIVEE